MSYPASGFPDYSRYEANAGRTLAILDTPLSNGPATAVLSTTGFSYITIMNNSVGVTTNYEIFIEWMTVPTQAPPLMVQQIGPSFTSNNVIQVPVIGEWCRILHVAYIGPANESPISYIFGSNAYVGVPSVGSINAGIINGKQVVPAGSNDFQQSSGTYMGHVTVTCGNHQNNLWSCNLEWFNPALDTWNILYIWDGATYGIAAISDVYIPPYPMRLNALNNDTSPQTFLLTMQPG